MTEIEWMNIFGDNLVDILKDANMSQRELAGEMRVSESTISNYIHKRKIPSVRTIVNMAYALNINTDELIDFGDRID